MSKLISNINNNNNVLTFDINNSNNNFKISLSNALRRTIMNDVKCYAVDTENIEIIENTGTIDNELLKSRLALIPINNELEDVNYDNIIISCKVTNNEDYITNIYAKDFKIVEREPDDILGDAAENKAEKNIEPTDIFRHGYENILYAKLKPNQSIHLVAKLVSKTPYQGGAVFCPTSVCVYTFKVNEEKCKELTKDMSDKDKNSFNTLDRKRHFEVTDRLEPKIFQFKIESMSQYQNINILKKGIDMLNRKLINFNNNLIDNNNDIVEIKKYDGNIDAYDIHIKNENDTLGNLISQYLVDENLFFSGYIVQHPLREELIIRVSIDNINKSNNNENNLKQVINKTINRIIKQLEQLISEIK